MPHDVAGLEGKDRIRHSAHSSHRVDQHLWSIRVARNRQRDLPNTENIDHRELSLG